MTNQIGSLYTTLVSFRNSFVVHKSNPIRNPTSFLCMRKSTNKMVQDYTSLADQLKTRCGGSSIGESLRKCISNRPSRFPNCQYPSAVFYSCSWQFETQASNVKGVDKILRSILGAEFWGHRHKGLVDEDPRNCYQAFEDLSKEWPPAFKTYHEKDESTRMRPSYSIE
jgi:hypothetical protein